MEITKKQKKNKMKLIYCIS